MLAKLLILVVGALTLVIGRPDAFSQEPVLRVYASTETAALSFFGLDTKGTGRAARNLLCADTAVTLRSESTAVEFVEATVSEHAAAYTVKTSAEPRCSGSYPGPKGDWNAASRRRARRGATRVAVPFRPARDRDDSVGLSLGG